MMKQDRKLMERGRTAAGGVGRGQEKRELENVSKSHRNPGLQIISDLGHF
jgi:hypothetical protein